MILLATGSRGTGHSMDNLRDTTDALARQGKPYALALVVRCESPTSAKPGARGVVTADGTLTGWIGGGCAQPIVIEESRRALRDGTARLVRITPSAGKADVDGIHAYEMVCYSGGTMDIFIEPVLPAPQVVILGRSPVARTLAGLARALKFDVVVYAPGARAEDFGEPTAFAASLDLSHLARPRQSFLVVSTQGEDDEGAVTAALAAGAPYVAFVASPKKWKAVSALLLQQGAPREAVERVHVPAGLEINAQEPEEIALSILAQIVSLRRSEAFAPAGEEAPAAQGAKAHGQHAHGQGAGGPAAKAGPSAIDPVCGMTVDVDTARYRSTYQQQSVYFCCAGCKSAFDADPAKYARAGGAR